MDAKVQKWGNSLAIRIPKPFADEAGISDDCKVTLSLKNRKIIISPLSSKKLHLEQLLSQMTEQNLHSEISTGPQAGKEIW